MLPASELKLAASATAGKFSSADGLRVLEACVSPRESVHYK